MGFFSKAFKGKASGASTPIKNKKRSGTANGAVPAPPPKPHWDDAWTRKEVEAEEIHELLRGCTHELKSRGMEEKPFMANMRLINDSSARHALPPLALSTGVGSKRRTDIHSQLLQCRKGFSPGRGAFRAGIGLDRAHGELDRLLHDLCMGTKAIRYSAVS